MTQTRTELILYLIFWGCWGATLYTYFLYPMLLYCLSKLAPQRPYVQSTLDLPYITMVVSAYNEQAVIAQKIENCKQLDYPPHKIVFLIGSDGSEDGTWEILNRQRDKRFRMVNSKQRRGKAAMLNHLLELADSEIVVFSDANTMYEPAAIRELVKGFQKPQTGCVIGKLILWAPQNDAAACDTEGLYWKYENRLKQLESTLGMLPTINGGIFAIRRKLYEKLPEQAITEDQLLGMKIMARGYRCVFAENAIAREKVSNLTGELRRRIRISAGNFQSLFLVPEILYPQSGRIAFAFISHKILRWLVPFFLVGMLGANIFLVGKSFYGGVLLIQGLFYASGLLGVLIPKPKGVLKLLSIPKYFISMNLAILLGLTRFLTGRQAVTWAKVIRR